MNILIIGGMHGNEPLGIEIVRALERDPVPNVSAVFGNPMAVKKGVRFIEADLNRMFPGKVGGVTEERRAAALMKATQGFDVVLDFHNTHAPRNDFGFVGGGKYEKLLPIAAALNIPRVIVVDYNCINKFVPTCMSVEVSLDSAENSVPRWLKKIKALAELERLPNTKLPSLYRYVSRVTREMQDREQFTWEVGVPIPAGDAKKLGLEPGTYLPVFVDDAYTPYNYAGLITLLKK